MSTRNFDTATMGLGGEAVETVIFAFIDFVGEPTFLHSSVGVIQFANEDWYGVGALGAVEPVREQMGLSSSRVRLVLSAATAQYLNEALNEATWGRLLELYAGTWDGAALTRAPELQIRGRMGPPEVTIGGKGNQISVIVEDIRGALDRVNGKRSTLLDHQQDAPGDTFYALLPAMLDHRFVFNGAALGGNNVQPGVPIIAPIHLPTGGLG